VTSAAWLVTGALAVGALLAGRHLRPDCPNQPRTAERLVGAPAVRQPDAPCTFDRQALREELQAIVHEPSPASPIADALAQAPPEPTAQQRSAAARGESVVADAVTRRRWTSHDGDQLREALDAMAHDQRMATLSSLMVAINRGDLVPENPILF
jgi:hypothetical protein